MMADGGSDLYLGEIVKEGLVQDTDEDGRRFELANYPKQNTRPATQQSRSESLKVGPQRGWGS